MRLPPPAPRPPVRTLLIDNYDSFTYNLVHLLARVNGCPPVVLRNDDVAGLRATDLTAIDAVVVSPGPGHPAVARDFGISAWAIAQPDLPVLGVCLGHQGLCLGAGARIGPARDPRHGRVSAVYHDGTGLFAGLPSPFDAVRYHSLLVYDLPANMEVLAQTADGLLMAARDRTRPRWGVQFHPESIATGWGGRLLANFRDLVQDNVRTSTGIRRVAAARNVAPARTPSPPPDASRYRLHVRELPWPPDAEAAFAALFAADPAAFWLDSSRVIPGLSRFSVLGGAGPLAELVSYRVGTGEVTVGRGDGTPIARHREDVFSYLERCLAQRRVPDPGLPIDFNLGYVGYLGYELKADCGARAAHRSAQPDAALLFCDRALVIDHETGQGWLLTISGTDDADGQATADSWLDRAAVLLRRAVPVRAPIGGGTGVLPVVARHSTAEYADLIRRCQEQIRAGESYEICLTNMLTVPVRVDPLRAYQRLRRANPAPYAAYVKLPGVTVLSSSPERFLLIDRDGAVESKPIKGTRPRGRDAAADTRLRDELRDSEKDRAENLMVVDLVRNDLGRVCELDSVHVPSLFAIESYQTVHQLVSTIRGRLRPDSSAVDCVRAAFPGGSMTGAPKLRTLEILDRLEGGPRGVYSGALGYLSLNGAADLSIVIRTMVITADEVSIGVGGAITALSDPAAEIDESRVKAGVLLSALASAVDEGACADAVAATPR
ncbi:MAG: para-aminobenzoate synthetase [Micromonosporaceae bacterium]|nr:para-aminobenzoate synthetase [Micromonosporaceae bacterium]